MGALLVPTILLLFGQALKGGVTELQLLALVLLLVFVILFLFGIQRKWMALGALFALLLPLIAAGSCFLQILFRF